jgi:hypothetical protein
MAVCIQNGVAERRDGVCTVSGASPTTLTRISDRFPALSGTFESCVHGKCIGIRYIVNNPVARVGLINAVCPLSTSWWRRLYWWLDCTSHTFLSIGSYMIIVAPRQTCSCANPELNGSPTVQLRPTHARAALIGWGSARCAASGRHRLDGIIAH